MVLDSPPFFLSLTSSSYPWLVALWCFDHRECFHSSSPTCHFLFGTGYFTFTFWISPYFLTFCSKKIISTVSFSWHGSSFHHFLLHLPSVFFFFHCSVFTPSLSFIGVFLFSCSPSLLCCSMGNTGNHGEQLCNIHGDLAVVRYEPHPCLLACCGLESVEGSFCLFFLVCEQYPICMYEHVLYVSMHAHVALLIPILWPGSLGPPPPQATATGDLKQSTVRYLTFH